MDRTMYLIWKCATCGKWLEWLGFLLGLGHLDYRYADLDLSVAWRMIWFNTTMLISESIFPLDPLQALNLLAQLMVLSSRGQWQMLWTIEVRLRLADGFIQMQLVSTAPHVLWQGRDFELYLISFQTVCCEVYRHGSVVMIWSFCKGQPLATGVGASRLEVLRRAHSLEPRSPGTARQARLELNVHILEHRRCLRHFETAHPKNL